MVIDLLEHRCGTEVNNNPAFEACTLPENPILIILMCIITRTPYFISFMRDCDVHVLYGYITVKYLLYRILKAFKKIIL